MRGWLRCGWLVAALLYSGTAQSRLVQMTLWISGGAEGVVYGGEEAPGWLGVSRHVSARQTDGIWLEAGGTRDWAELAEVDGLRMPDIVVPSEGVIRHAGMGVLADPAVPWTLLNVSALPQFPHYTVPVPASRGWSQEDGVGVRVFGLWSARAPLRIPPIQLRPLRIEDPGARLRHELSATTLSAEELPVVVLPVDADAGDWSKPFPGVRVWVAPPGPYPEVVELDGGRRVRVRPARNGRAVIRVTLRWDTVSRTFLDPLAEVDWVRPPDLENLDLPPDLVKRLRPLTSFSIPEVEKPHRGKVSFLAPSRYQIHADVETGGSRLPDAWRIRLLPEDTVWTVWRFTEEERQRLRDLDLPVEALPPPTREVKDVWIPARLAAGNGGDAWLTLRRFLDEVEEEPDIVPRTQRERLVPLEMENRE